MPVEPQVVAGHWHVLAILTVVAILGKIVVVALSSIAIGERSDTAVRARFAMAQVGPVFAYLIPDRLTAVVQREPSVAHLAIAVSTISGFARQAEPRTGEKGTTGAEEPADSGRHGTQNGVHAGNESNRSSRGKRIGRLLS